MATFESALHALQKSTRANLSRLPAPNQAGGALQFAVVPIALVGTEVTNDTVDLCLLPAGAIPVPGASSIDCEVPGTALVVDIGFASDVDALADGVDVSAGGSFLFTAGTMPTAALVPAAIASTDTKIVAKLVSVDTATASAKVIFKIAYKMPA